jgi:hypothetical protein
LQELVTDTTFRIGSFTVNGALIDNILLPKLLVTALLAWPYLDRSSIHATGVWFAAERKKQNLVFLLIIVTILAFHGWNLPAGSVLGLLLAVAELAGDAPEILKCETVTKGQGERAVAGERRKGKEVTEETMRTGNSSAIRYLKCGRPRRMEVVPTSCSFSALPSL